MKDSEELKGGLCTTVVGSFPYSVDRGLMEKEDWSLVPQIRDTSTEALDFQVERGIDYPSDGQFFDMLDMYLVPLKVKGYLSENGFGEAHPPEDHPALKLEALLQKNALARGAAGLRMPISGPFSLAYRVKKGGTSLAESGDEEGLTMLARGVEAFVKSFDKALDGSILSVDEPVLPFIRASFDEGFIVDTLNRIFRQVRNNYTCMHVCGEISSIKDLSLSLEVGVLDHEFQGSDNQGVYDRSDLEDNHKMLSLGIVNTNPRQIFAGPQEPRAESVEEILAKIVEVADIYGFENLLLSPDCGFGGWKSSRISEEFKWRLISEKLSNMVAARNEFLKKL